jgi:tRNA nucleotidyltransferase (CCA-adding enzyme)
MRHILPPRLLYEFAEILATTGKRCFLVGGAVRDYILGRPVSDYDLTTDAHPEEVMNLFSHVILTGVKHGTVTVLWKGLRLETTTFRTEKGYSDGRRPDEVRFASTIDEDLGRRDFTINAMAYDLVTRELVDPYEGQSDLSRQIIRAVGDPKLRFFEDGLRPLRAIRFATQLGFDIDPATFGAIPGALERFKLISVERIRDELQKIILSPWPSRGLKLMEECGMLAVVIPELASSRGTEQKGMHRFDVLDHLFVSLDAAPADLIIRLAALFHDVGKPAAKVETPGAEPTFHRHEEISFRMAAAILRRLRFPNSLIEEVCHLVRQHMFSYDESWSDAAVRRFVCPK